MAKSLFAYGGEPRCAWCAHGRPTSDGTKLLCPYKGVVDPSFHCRRCRYDPLRREPKPAPKLPAFSPKDFSL